MRGNLIPSSRETYEIGLRQDRRPNHAGKGVICSGWRIAPIRVVSLPENVQELPAGRSEPCSSERVNRAQAPTLF